MAISFHVDVQTLAVKFHYSKFNINRYPFAWATSLGYIHCGQLGQLCCIISLVWLHLEKCHQDATKRFSYGIQFKPSQPSMKAIGPTAGHFILCRLLQRWGNLFEGKKTMLDKENPEQLHKSHPNVFRPRAVIASYPSRGL